MHANISLEGVPVKTETYRLPNLESDSIFSSILIDPSADLNAPIAEGKTLLKLYSGILSLNTLNIFCLASNLTHQESAIAISITSISIPVAYLYSNLPLTKGINFIIYLTSLLSVIISSNISNPQLPEIVFALSLTNLAKPFISLTISFTFLLLTIYSSRLYLDPESFFKVLLEACLIFITLYKIPSPIPAATKRGSYIKRESITKENDEIDNNSPLISVVSSINNTIALLSREDEGSKQVEAIESLTKVLKVLTKSQNIYAPSLKKITKNMDIEDKIFMEQNTQHIPHTELKNQSLIKPNIIDTVYGVSELSGILKQIGKEWNFNTFFVHNCTGGASISTCGEYIFRHFNFFKIFSINEADAKCFLRTVELKYLANPYHNSCHAADVMISFLFLSSSVNSLTPCVELFASIIACLSHDIGHPGTNNRFLVQTQHHLALYYNDNSVLENMHARDLFEILKEERSNVLKNAGDYWVIRKIIIELILATDMAKHFEILNLGKAKQKPINQRMESSVERLDIYKLFIKAADISHTSKSLELHEKWCKLLIEEFFAQGDMEKSLGLQVSMYCDRETTDIHKSQSGFIKNIALPLFETVHFVLEWPKIEEICLGQLKSNITHWEKRKSSSRNSLATIPDLDCFRIISRRTTMPQFISK